MAGPPDIRAGLGECAYVCEWQGGKGSSGWARGLGGRRVTSHGKGTGSGGGGKETRDKPGQGSNQDADRAQGKTELSLCV